MTPTERRRRARMLSIRDVRIRKMRRTTVFFVDRPIPWNSTMPKSFCVLQVFGSTQYFEFRYRRMVQA